VLKEHTEINSHARCITLTVRETEPSLLSFAAIFFQTAPVFFFFSITEMGILMSFTGSVFTEIMWTWACSEGQFGKILVCLITKSKADVIFLKHELSEGKKLQRMGLKSLRSCRGRGKITNAGEKVVLFINKEQFMLPKQRRFPLD